MVNINRGFIVEPPFSLFEESRNHIISKLLKGYTPGGYEGNPKVTNGHYDVLPRICFGFLSYVRSAFPKRDCG